MTQNLQQISGTLNRRDARQRLEKLLGAAAFLLLIGAWVYGYFRTGSDVESYLQQMVPEADRFTRSGAFWEVYTRNADEEQQLIAYVGRGSAPSYGGPLDVLVAVDLDGIVTGSMVIDHRDTPSFFHTVAASGFLDQIPGKSFQDPFRVGEDIDAVTGATITSAAISRAVREVALRIASDELSRSVELPEKEIKFGAPEISLILLYLVSFSAHRPKFRYKNLVRWISMIAGLVVLGFWLNRPLTIAHFTSLLSGYIPDWRENLYWFLLIGGIVLGISVENRNPYCSWFCPFGAFQECLSAVGKTRWHPSREWQFRLQWSARALAFAALFFGLALRQPGATSYEIFGTLFDLKGSTFQWALLVLIILSSLVIYRPWCTYLCPLDPVVDFLTAVRKWSKSLWLKISTKK